MKCVRCQRGAVDNISQPGSIHLDLAVAVDTQTHTTSQPDGNIPSFSKYFGHPPSSFQIDINHLQLRLE
jgi:hypothetical protein